MREESSPDGLLWLDRPFRELIRLAWPITVSMLSYSIMTLTDTLFVSRMGAEALAGVGLGGVAAFSFLCFSIGLLRGAKVLVSQAVGAGRHDDVGSYLAAGIAIALQLGALTVVAAQLVAPLVGSLAAGPEAGRVASDYLRVRIVSAPLLLLFVALRETRYGQGDARSPMIASVVGNAANIALDFVFVYVWGFGATGVAWASVIANGVEAGVLIALSWRGPVAQALRRGSLRRGRAVAGTVWRTGVPLGVQFLLQVGSFSLLSALISAMSAVEMAAHQIALQVLHFSFLPAHSVAEAGSVMAGQAIGARRPDLIGGVARRAVLVTTSYNGLCALVFWLGAPVIARAFTSDPALLSVTIGLLHTAVLFLVLDGAYMVGEGVLRGTGDVRFAAFVGIACAWALTPPLTWVLGYELGLGARGGWLGLFAEISVAAALVWWRLKSGGWRQASERMAATTQAVPAAEIAAEAA